MSNRLERASDKKQIEQHQKILKELLQLPDNKICADCKKRDPRWISVNLGIFICLRCSGIHRSLGVHISKVRSVDLDTLLQEHIDTLVRIGNQRANAYWEHSLPAGQVPDDGRIESFIRSKYEYKKFVGGDLPGQGSAGQASIQSQPPHNQQQQQPKPQQQPLLDLMSTQPQQQQPQQNRPNAVQLMQQQQPKEQVKPVIVAQQDWTADFVGLSFAPPPSVVKK